MTFRRMVAAARRTHEPNTIPFMYRTRLSTCAACIRDKDHLPNMISCMYKFRTWGYSSNWRLCLQNSREPQIFHSDLGTLDQVLLPTSPAWCPACQSHGQWSSFGTFHGARWLPHRRQPCSPNSSGGSGSRSWPLDRTFVGLRTYKRQTLRFLNAKDWTHALAPRDASKSQEITAMRFWTLAFYHASPSQIATPFGAAFQNANANGMETQTEPKRKRFGNAAF